MPNGLEAGDSVRGSDTISWLRGERAERSPGRRDVRVDDIVTYLNDPDVLNNVGGGLGADELARIELLEKNLGVNFLRDSIAEGWTVFEMVDGFTDVYTDESGVNTGSSTGYVYNGSNDYYANDPGSQHDLLIQSGGNVASDPIVDTTSVHTVTSVGGIDHSTSSAKFGTSSFDFNGTDAYMTVPSSTDWDFGTGDFTMELFYQPGATGPKTRNALISRVTSGNVGWMFWIDNNSLRFQINTGILIDGGSLTWTNGTWYHLALSRVGGTLSIYRDGLRLASVSNSTNLNLNSEELWIGAQQRSGFPDYCDGFVEEVSVLNGTGRYSGADVTADIPSSPYAVSTQNMTLVGASQTADSAPTNARMVILYDPVDSVTLNTDCTLEISRDGGSTFDAFTLTKEADYGTIDGGTVEILTTEDLTLAATSGTSMVYRFSTANNKNQRLHGVYVQWR